MRPSVTNAVKDILLFNKCMRIGIWQSKKHQTTTNYKDKDNKGNEMRGKRIER
jgi:hypothetical protein